MTSNVWAVLDSHEGEVIMSGERAAGTDGERGLVGKVLNPQMGPRGKLSQIII